MIEQNDIENPNILPEIKNINKNGIEYEIPFPEPLARSIEKFVDKFHTSYEKLFNYLLNNHFHYLHYQIIADDNELLTFYYFCIDDIFSENSNSECKVPNKPETNAQNITVKISEEYNTAIKKICEKYITNPKILLARLLIVNGNALKVMLMHDIII